MHVTNTICRPGFYEIVADKFRAVVRHENVDKLRDYLGLNPKQLVRKATTTRGGLSGKSRSHMDYQRKPIEAIRAGIKSQAVGKPYQWQRDDIDGDAPRQCRRPAFELAGEVAAAPYSQLCFWSYCWAYASAREGLHIFDDTVAATEEA